MNKYKIGMISLGCPKNQVDGEAMLAKLQEKTPAFTTLQNATVPIRPSKPKRMIFVLGMCVLAVFGTSLWIIRKSIFAKSGDSK